MSASTRHPQQIVALGLAVVMVTSSCTSSCTNAPSVGQGGVAPASAPTPALAPPDAAAIAAVRDASQRILASTPKSIFDPDQKATELGADVNALFTFVRDNVRHEIYAGVLRGARGTLISHAGNAWDKSALLAALLRHHGRDVRFARGRLTPDRAAALVTKMFDQARQPAPGPVVDVPASVATRGRDLIARIEARWRGAQSDLMGALDRAGVTLGQNPPVTEAMLTEEAADHAWVEYRDGDRWVALDSSAAGQPGEAVATATETFAEIPDARQHRVTFRVKVEERRNQALTERDAFIWPTMAGALHGTNVLFTHQIGQTPLGGWRATPTLVVDQQAYGALSFTAGGLEVPAKPSDALVGEASRQVQGVGRINELFGAPASQAQPTPTGSELTAVWLDVEFTDPSGHSETVRREILDRIGPVARGQGAGGTALVAPAKIPSVVPIPLLGLYACAVTAGPLDMRLTTERLSSSFEIFADAQELQKVAQTSGAALPVGQQARLRHVLDALPAMSEGAAQGIHVLSQRLARRLQTGERAVLFYEATPRLVIVSVDPNASAPAIDLRRNVLRVVARGVAGQDIVRANLARGVLDGVIEDSLVTQAIVGVPNAAPVSTVEILGRARADGIRIVAVSGTAGTTALTIPDAARARFAAVLGREVVVAPERTPSSANTHFAWWQVDRSTGDTVGVLDTGLHGGQAIPERATIHQTVSDPMARVLFRPGGFALEDLAAERAIALRQGMEAGALLAGYGMIGIAGQIFMVAGIVAQIILLGH